MNKIELSLEKATLELGFLYWVNETHNLRGLKGLSIEKYKEKIRSLYKEYKVKYPEGLTGWTNA